MLDTQAFDALLHSGFFVISRTLGTAFRENE